MRREANAGEGNKARRGKATKATPAPPSSASPVASASVAASSSIAASASVTASPRRRVSPSVVIVGAGRLGTALGRALASCGYDVAAVVARRARHAARAAALVSTGTRALSAAQLRHLPAADFLFITTPDDEITRTAMRLADATRLASTWHASSTSMRLPTSRRTPSSVRPVALHASGALSSDALAPLRACGYAVGSMHPLVSVSEPIAGAESLRSAYYCIEGERAAACAARRLVGHLGGRSFSIATKDKALYHAAAVMTSGHTVALFQLATELLARCGLGERAARRVLLPLLQSTIENLSTQTPARALTGTFARADAATVRKHLVALAGQDTVDAGISGATLVYALLGLQSLRLAEHNRALDPAALREIARALNEVLHGSN